MTPAVIFLAATGSEEDGFWVQLLVIVILAASWGVYTLVTKAKKSGTGFYQAWIRQGYNRLNKLVGGIKSIKIVSGGLSRSGENEPVGNTEIEITADMTVERSLQNVEKKRDVKSGMELLARDYLVSVIEQTNNLGPQDVEMRRLCLIELIRRDQLNALSGDSLKNYITNENGLYGKDIQYAAMKELAGRSNLS